MTKIYSFSLNDETFKIIKITNALEYKNVSILERVDAAKGVTKRKITGISYENKRYCTLTLSEAEMKKEVVHILTITHFRL